MWYLASLPVAFGDTKFNIHPECEEGRLNWADELQKETQEDEEEELEFPKFDQYEQGEQQKQQEQLQQQPQEELVQQVKAFQRQGDPPQGLGGGLAHPLERMVHLQAFPNHWPMPSGLP